LLRKNNYQKVLIAFDKAKVSFRRQIYPDYKINRLVTPLKLLQQINVLKVLLTQSGIPTVELTNFEADDLIASFFDQNWKLHPD